MSNFKCEKCGKTCLDSDKGFISGCKHYPPDTRQDLAGQEITALNQSKNKKAGGKHCKFTRNEKNVP